ncbi:MAG: GAF domain-containing protein [Anaerolineae bacterium]|nr:GAF domain-containing protein [Anaerolineae bacterium]
MAARTAELTRANAQLQQEIAERMRAETAEREQRVMAEALRDTAAILNATLDFNEVLERILTNVERVVPHDAASVTLVDNGVARVVRERGYAENGVKADMLRFPIEETATLKAMVATQQPLVIPDVQDYDDWVDVPDERWIRAYAGAPIFLEGKLIGFLNLNSGAPNTFNETHAERLQAFADQAALAIKNARLYQAEHGQRALAEALRDSAAALSATLDYDEVLDRILTNVGRVVPHDAANIMLIDGDVVRMVRCHGFAAFGFSDDEVLSVRFPHQQGRQHAPDARNQEAGRHPRRARIPGLGDLSHYGVGAVECDSADPSGGRGHRLSRSQQRRAKRLLQHGCGAAPGLRRAGRPGDQERAPLYRGAGTARARRGAPRHCRRAQRHAGLQRSD